MDNLLVLVIDDSSTNRVLIQSFLTAAGARTLTADTAQQGTDLALEHRPDVIVLDVVLPDGDGVDLCRRWRSDHRLRDIPVLLVSGERLGDQDRAAGLRSGALGYLLKPFTDVELIAQVHLLHQLGQTHRQLRTRNAQLEASNRELEQFAYVVSHDLKEPLRTITGYCRLLAQHCAQRQDAATEQLVGIIVNGTDRMQRLIDDLLAYSRVGKTDQPMEAVDLAAVVRQVLDNLKAAIDESGATIDVGCLPHVQGNRLLLGQLFQNLVDNAIKFRGSQPPRVQISAENAGGQWCITVVDNGIGIDPRYFEQVFGVFQRLHNREEYAGTGIGLALCKKIVEHHGGRIRLESAPGQGATFYVDLPGEGGTNATT